MLEADSNALELLCSLHCISPKHEFHSSLPCQLKAVTSLSVCALPLLYTWQERLLVGCAHCCAQLQTLVALELLAMDEMMIQHCGARVASVAGIADQVSCSMKRALMAAAGLQVIPSRGVKVAGLLGPASPTDRKGTSFSDTPVGIGGTTQWKLAGLVRCRPPMPCVRCSLVASQSLILDVPEATC